MKGRHLIDHCERLCNGKGLFSSVNINRMIELAGNPRAFPFVVYGFHTMPEQMRVLVDLAKKRLGRPAGGLPIKVGHAYRDVNGEVRKVVDMPPHHRSFDVVWQSANDKGHMRLDAFQEWALEEVTP